jgi:hypothetical protein
MGVDRGCVENSANFLRKIALGIRFAQEMHTRIEPSLMHDGVLRVAGREQDWQIGSFARVCPSLFESRFPLWANSDSPFLLKEVSMDGATLLD